MKTTNELIAGQQAEIAALRKAGQQALDALDNGLPEARDKAAKALRQAIAQAVQTTKGN